MAHLVESMFYNEDADREVTGTRFVPWHGLGTPVQGALTSKEALVAAGLDWNVVQRPVYTEGKEIPNYKANVRDSDNSVLGIVTNRYQIVQNTEAFDFTDSLVREGVTYDTAGSLNNGKRVWLLAKLPRTRILDDAIDPYICFTNSHDGLGSIKVCATPIRVVCNNTLSLALNGAKRSWSTKHIGNIASKLEEAKHTLLMANQYMTELEKTADIMANSKVTEDEVAKIVNELFPIETSDSDRKAQNMNKARDAFYVCYFAPDIMKFMNTKWGLINAAADFATHTSPTRATQAYASNNWGRVIDGHPILNAVYDKLAVGATV